MNYGELKAEILTFVNRPDQAQNVQSFVRMAHGRICSYLDTPDSLKTVALDDSNAVLESGNVWRIPMPVDVLEVRYVLVNDRTVESWPEGALYNQFGSNWAGKARGYAVSGSDLLLAPGTSDNIRLAYKMRLPDFVDDTDTNWLLNAHPDIYLYGALVHLNELIQDAEQMAVCDGLYSREEERARVIIENLSTGGQPRIRSA